ncbi:hypothetical protein MLD38_040652 [Melastoma candidum]|nr:hypothetical protein MLD38_040652 [Melastoma candidum]
MGPLKTENSSSSNSMSESKKPTPPSSEIDHSSLTPPSINFPSLRSQLDDDEAEVQSPTSALLESFFSDQIDPGAPDFMISSPVRSSYSPPIPPHGNYTCPSGLPGQTSSSMPWYSNSPPRLFPSSSSHLNQLRGKGLSPLHKVYNSPNNNNNDGDGGNNVGSGSGHLALPAIEDFLEDYHKDDGDDHRFEEFTASHYDDAPINCLSIGISSKYCGSGSVSDTTAAPRNKSQVMQDEGGDVYNQLNLASSSAHPSLQLQQAEQLQGKLQQGTLHPPQSTAPTALQTMMHGHHASLANTLMAPMPFTSDQEQDSGLQLVHLLLACAEAVSKEDYKLARRHLHQLNRVVTPLGDSMQRVASCFTEALTARLAAILTTCPTASSSMMPFSPFPPNSLEILKIYQILYQACPYIKFAHFTANQAIFEAIEFEERVHVIDLDILQGYQWPAFMQALAARPSGPPFLRITGVGTDIGSVRETGRCLTELAHSLHIPFQFHAVGENLQDLKPHMLNRRVGEALAVNSVNRLHRIHGNHLGNLLAMIRDQAPNIVTLVEQEASHNGPYFLGRFLEALHYYSALFDSLDATFPPESAQRAKVEQYIFAPEIRNIVACEGAERIERHERLDKWRKIMEGRGFKGVPLSGNAITQSKVLLGLYSTDGYRLNEDKGCLLLAWQDRDLVAASAWRC